MTITIGALVKIIISIGLVIAYIYYTKKLRDIRKNNVIKYSDDIAKEVEEYKKSGAMDAYKAQTQENKMSASEEQALREALTAGFNDESKY